MLCWLLHLMVKQHGLIILSGWDSALVFPSKIAPKSILKSQIPLCVRCVCFMWLFSDLHALEVELWIHCFCTRPHQPFKSSDCYRANLWLCAKVSVKACFLATFEALSLTCPKQNDHWWDLTDAVMNLDWIVVSLVFQVMTVTRSMCLTQQTACSICESDILRLLIGKFSHFI